MAVLEQLMAPGGGFDQLADCIAAGKTRFGGISSHNPDVLRAAIEAGLCDIAMFPVGAFVNERYITETLPLCQARGVGSICFKTFGAGKLLGDTPATTSRCNCARAASSPPAAWMMPWPCCHV
jgi:aryl-alcohol dehydrogenase-like predicted oxidoreductase